MKTKIILALLALLTITYSCERNDEQEITHQKKEVTKKKEVVDTFFRDQRSLENTKKVSDTIKTKANAKDDSETVNPGDLGTPPTRP
ncbi:Uncharacterised protein [Chryseobacterium nakagawai]|uniref:Lipoprotein n=1 Tax=Chryseobacterium nakagawai TaxID=1241982 RepID=A0AAD0YU36_CHRNA|nr:hypothetical protein [Chryseobacterium nakagawai]AZA93046.1 hypothetical protein EG343_21800 [Chryseobacterium nakagawai]VEH19679.1 Uncharacterised protein [Chryseobacterium nakagawai]